MNKPQHFFWTILAVGTVLGFGTTAMSQTSNEFGPILQSSDPIEPLNSALSLDPIDQIELTLAPQLPTPKSVAVPHTQNQSKSEIWAMLEWESPNVVYRNLVFEEPMLERFGQTTRPRIQSAVSGAKFYTRGILLPLQVLRGKHRSADSSNRWAIPSINY